MTGSQWSLCRIGVMCAVRLTLAEMFWILCSWFVSHSGKLERREFALSRREVTNAWVRIRVDCLSRQFRMRPILLIDPMAVRHVFLMCERIVMCSSNIPPRFRASADGVICASPTVILICDVAAAVAHVLQLHCNCNTWGKNLWSINWLKMQPNYVVPRNTPYLCILHDKEVHMISFITAVEINMHDFQLQ